MLDFLAFPDHARIWIYQSNQQFPEAVLDQVNREIYHFSQVWTSHNRQLKATGGLLHERFVILVVDESNAGASGCSIDSSVRFVKSLEQKYNLELFDRMSFCYIEDQEVRSIRAGDLPGAVTEGQISGETLFFDNLVDNKADFINRWVVPLEKSWMQRFSN